LPSRIGVCLGFAAVALAVDASGARLQAPAGRIVFESTRTGNSDIWVANADGTKQQNLTAGSKVDDSSPSLAPDGSRIVFARVRGDRSELWIMNVDGSAARRLGSAKGSETHPAWSPTGDRVAFVSLYHGVWDVYVAALDGTRSQLTRDSAAQLNVSWSPKGDRLVSDRIAKGSSDLWTIPAKGGRPKRLTKTPRLAELNPAWSAVRDRIAYDAADGRRIYDLYVLNPTKGTVRRVTRDKADDGDPAWAPDGAWLAYRREVRGDYEIARIRASGRGQPINVSRDPIGLDLAPSWGPAPVGPATRAPATSAGWIFACDKSWPGTSANETLYGNANVNHMCGDGGSDHIYGKESDDYISGGSGTDYLYGGYGNDWLKARDGYKDYLYGGYGYDHGLVDANDYRSSVEDPQS
jgi:Tol biopolymer transport system component